jgi:hypothetical protein
MKNSQNADRPSIRRRIGTRLGLPLAPVRQTGADLRRSAIKLSNMLSRRWIMRRAAAQRETARFGALSRKTADIWSIGLHHSPPVPVPRALIANVECASSQ